MAVLVEALSATGATSDKLEAETARQAKVVALPAPRQEKESKDEEIAVLSLLLF